MFAGLDDFFASDPWDDAGYPDSFTETTVERRGGGKPVHILIYVFVVAGIEPGHKVFYVGRHSQYVLCLHKVNNACLLSHEKIPRFHDNVLRQDTTISLLFVSFVIEVLIYSFGVLSMFLKVR